jgi:hypothetical protein
LPERQQVVRPKEEEAHHYCLAAGEEVVPVRGVHQREGEDLRKEAAAHR